MCVCLRLWKRISLINHAWQDREHSLRTLLTDQLISHVASRSYKIINTLKCLCEHQQTGLLCRPPVWVVFDGHWRMAYGWFFSRGEEASRIALVFLDVKISRADLFGISRNPDTVPGASGGKLKQHQTWCGLCGCHLQIEICLSTLYREKIVFVSATSPSLLMLSVPSEPCFLNDCCCVGMKL